MKRLNYHQNMELVDGSNGSPSNHNSHGIIYSEFKFNHPQLTNI